MEVETVPNKSEKFACWGLTRCDAFTKKIIFLKN